MVVPFYHYQRLRLEVRGQHGNYVFQRLFDWVRRGQETADQPIHSRANCIEKYWYLFVRHDAVGCKENRRSLQIGRETFRLWTELVERAQGRHRERDHLVASVKYRRSPRVPLDTLSCLVQQLIQRHTSTVQLHMLTRY